MKYILKMAFKNIGRNKRRTFLSAIAISIAVMIVLVMRGYIGGIIDSLFDSLVKIETGHIKIQHPEYQAKEDMMPLEYKVDGFDGSGYKQVIQMIESIPSIKTIAPRIKFGVLLSYNGKTQSAMGMGISPKIEKTIIPFDKIMINGEYLTDDENAKSIIIGEDLASKLGIKLGNKITIVVKTAYDSLKGITFKVAGIFKYGISSIDSKLFYIPIGTASKLLEMDNGVSELILWINKPEDAEQVSQEIRSRIIENASSVKYSVIPWQDQESLLSVFRKAMPMYNSIYLGLLILASTVIINTTMMVIFERTREIGTMGALGMSGGRIVLLFVLEATIVSAIGSLIGVVVGGAIDLFLSIVGINFSALTGGSMSIPIDIVHPRFELSLLFGSFVFGVAVASIFAYFPARRAAKIEPAEALRAI